MRICLLLRIPRLQCCCVQCECVLSIQIRRRRPLGSLCKKKKIASAVTPFASLFPFPSISRRPADRPGRTPRSTAPHRMLHAPHKGTGKSIPLARHAHFPGSAGVGFLSVLFQHGALHRPFCLVPFTQWFPPWDFLCLFSSSASSIAFRHFIFCLVSSLPHNLDNLAANPHFPARPFIPPTATTMTTTLVACHRFLSAQQSLIRVLVPHPPFAVQRALSTREI